MNHWLRQFISPPIFEDPEQTHRAAMLHTLLLITLAISVFFGIFLIVSSQNFLITFLLCLVLDLCLLFSFFILKKGQVKLSAYLFIISIWLVLSNASLIDRGLSSPEISTLILAVAFTGYILGGTAGYVFSGLCLLSILGIYLATLLGILPGPATALESVHLFMFHILNLTAATVAVYFISSRIQKNLNHALDSERQLKEKNREFEEIRTTLENHIEKRIAEILYQKKYFEALFTHSPLAIVSLDLQHRVIACNPAFGQLFGYSLEEIHGRDLDDFIAIDATQSEAKKFTNKILQGESLHAITQRRKKNGSTIDVEIFGVPVPVEENKIGILALYQDISERVRTQQALQESEEKYRLIVENAGDAIAYFDLNGKFLFLNTTAAKYINYPPQYILGKEIQSLIPGLTPENILGLKNLIEKDATNNLEGMVHLSDGPHWFWTNVQPLKNPAGETFAIQVIAHDITERKDAEKALQQSEQSFRTFFEYASIGMVIQNTEGRYIQVNRAFCEMVGYSADELLGMNYLQITHPNDITADQENTQRLLHGEIEYYQLEKRYIHKRGSTVWVLINFSLVRNASGNPHLFIGQIQDITSRKEVEQRLKYLATHDPLTDLPNRALYFDRLDHSLSMAKRKNQEVAVAFLDLDSFKLVNDTYGHDMGDRLLQFVAWRLQSSLRASDTVARFGGDEFAFIIENIPGNKGASNVVSKIHASLLQPFQVDDHIFKMTPSMGISLYPKDGEDAKTLFMRADQAMYCAKEGGRNKFEFFKQK
jgi:diguanylate cyclase (GGDEF)-like protein/PAS domain S-box-containing protein